MLQVRGRQKTLEVWSININPACFSQKTWETISCSWKSTHFKDDGFLLDYRINPLKKKTRSRQPILQKMVVPCGSQRLSVLKIMAVAMAFRPTESYRVSPTAKRCNKTSAVFWSVPVGDSGLVPLVPYLCEEGDANYLTQNKRISWQHAGI